ncbi:MAG TPA: AAA family ATPase, partial [Actinomycetes bacterium]|nr:AAA family ATPase [Actinomycetes bacterium]
QLFEALLALLERLADRSPTVLVVEDLHWADRSTLDLLAFLVRNLQAGLLVVLTYRTDELHRRHPLRPFLAELDRSGRAERLEVGRFDRPEVADLLAGIIGTRPDDGLVGQIYRRSEGNAFFAEELLAATQPGADNGRSLPPSLENVLLSRVQVLPEDAQATLRLVAAAGGRVGHGLLAAVSELPEADLLAALRAAVAHQVLVPDPATETYAFRHALTQEALYAELLPGGAGPAARRLRPRARRAFPARRARPGGRAGSARLPLGQGPRAGACATRRRGGGTAVGGGLRVRRRPAALRAGPRAVGPGGRRRRAARPGPGRGAAARGRLGVPGR